MEYERVNTASSHSSYESEPSKNQDSENVKVDIDFGNAFPTSEHPAVLQLPSNEIFRLFCLVIMWYICNTLHSITSKYVLNALPLPSIVGLCQLSFGWILNCIRWALDVNSAPCLKDSFDTYMRCFAIQSFCHIFLHFGAIFSICLASVSFTHMIKAVEPVVTAILSWMFLFQRPSLPECSTLALIIIGICLSSAKDTSFSWPSFIFAIASTVGSSARAVTAKKVLKNPDRIGTNLNPTNIYNIVIIGSTVMALPFAVLLDGPIATSTWKAATGPDSPHSAFSILLYLGISSICYFVYNQCAFSCLNMVHQTSYSVLNTFKRVFLIILSLFVFRTALDPLSMAGLAISVIGGLGYANSSK